MSARSTFAMTVARTIAGLPEPFTVNHIGAALPEQLAARPYIDIRISQILTHLKAQHAIRATVRGCSKFPSQYLRLAAFSDVLSRWTKEVEEFQARAARNAELLKMYVDERISYSEIARRTGLAMGTVATCIHQARINAGLKDKAPPSGSVHTSKITPELREQIFALRKAGLKGRDIADRTAVPIGTIYAVLNGHMARAADLREPLDPPTPQELAWRQFRSAELQLPEDNFYSRETFIT